jgi:CRISPR system Cascade subunit CasE
MYLSRISSNILDRKVLNLLKDPYHLHAGIMTAFPDTKRRNNRNEPSGVLFRREPSDTPSHIVHVLVQSRGKPDWTELTKRYWGSTEIEVRQIKPIFENGQKLNFRLRANPIVTREGKRRCLVGEESQRNWLKRKGQDAGFSVTSDSFCLIDEGVTIGEKGRNDQKHNIIFRTVLYQGCLQVNNAEFFLRKGIQTGIGPCKGFGCGLLSVPYKKNL